MKRAKTLIISLVVTVVLTALSGLLVDKNLNLELGKKDKVEMFCIPQLDAESSGSFATIVNEEQMHAHGFPFSYRFTADVDESCNLAGERTEAVPLLLDVAVLFVLSFGIVYMIRSKNES